MQAKAQTISQMRLNNYKSAYKSFSNKKHRNYFIDITYTMIMKVRTIGNLS